jgi:hypothetical protein
MKPKKANLKGKSQEKGDIEDKEDVTLTINAETALFNEIDESISN